MTAKASGITFDEEVMALYVQLTDADVLESLELAPNIYLDLDADGTPVGIEVLNVDPTMLPAIRRLPGALLVADAIKSRAA